MKKTIAILTISLLIIGCSANTTIENSGEPISLKVNTDLNRELQDSVSSTFNTTSFGQYKFKATKEGKEPFYGLLPLKFNGGYLVADILFFTPAMFFNLREVYPYYQFDMDAGVVRYKKNLHDEWLIYTPTPEEIEHAKLYFGES